MKLPAVPTRRGRDGAIRHRRIESVAKPSEISPKLEQTRLRPEALRARDFAAVRLAILTRHSSFGATAVHPRGKPRGILAKANKPARPGRSADFYPVRPCLSRQVAGQGMDREHKAVRGI